MSEDLSLDGSSSQPVDADHPPSYYNLKYLPSTDTWLETAYSLLNHHFMYIISFWLKENFLRPLNASAAMFPGQLRWDG